MYLTLSVSEKFYLHRLSLTNFLTGIAYSRRHHKSTNVSLYQPRFSVMKTEEFLLSFHDN
jgi:hypothetical protein